MSSVLKDAGAPRVDIKLLSRDLFSHYRDALCRQCRQEGRRFCSVQLESITALFTAAYKVVFFSTLFSLFYCIGSFLLLELFSKWVVNALHL